MIIGPWIFALILGHAGSGALAAVFGALQLGVDSRANIGAIAAACIGLL